MTTIGRAVPGVRVGQSDYADPGIKAIFLGKRNRNSQIVVTRADGHLPAQQTIRDWFSTLGLNLVATQSRIRCLAKAAARYMIGARSGRRLLLQRPAKCTWQLLAVE